MKWWHLVILVWVCVFGIWLINHKTKHDYIVTYSYIWTNGLMGFADVYVLKSTDNIGDIIAKGKTQLMIEHHIPQPVLINITRVK